MAHRSGPPDGGYQTIQSSSAAKRQAMMRPMASPYPWSTRAELGEALFTSDGLTFETHSYLRDNGASMTEAEILQFMNANHTPAATKEQLANMKKQRAQDMLKRRPDVPLRDDGSVRLPDRPFYVADQLTLSSFAGSLRKTRLQKGVPETINAILKDLHARHDAIQHLATVNVQEVCMLLDELQHASTDASVLRDAIKEISELFMDQQGLLREAMLQSTTAILSPGLLPNPEGISTLGASQIMVQARKNATGIKDSAAKKAPTSTASEDSPRRYAKSKSKVSSGHRHNSRGGGSFREDDDSGTGRDVRGKGNSPSGETGQSPTHGRKSKKKKQSPHRKSGGKDGDNGSSGDGGKRGHVPAQSGGRGGGRGNGSGGGRGNGGDGGRSSKGGRGNGSRGGGRNKGGRNSDPRP